MSYSTDTQRWAKYSHLSIWNTEIQILEKYYLKYQNTKYFTESIWNTKYQIVFSNTNEIPNTEITLILFFWNFILLKQHKRPTVC